jgi:hypothetical protein
VAGDTPLSGENIAIEATELESRVRAPSLSEADPTDVHVSPFDERPGEAMAPVPEPPGPTPQALRGVRDTDVTGRPARASVTEVTWRVPPPAAGRRATRRPTSPDDTIRVDQEASTAEGDPTQLMAPAAPKAPRR